MTSATDCLKALHAAGFADADLAVMLAIGFAESSFNANAVAHEPDGSTSYGVWQINSSHQFAELANGTWSNVTVNAQLAKRVFDAQGANAWSTHKPTDPIGFARYTAYLPVATALVTATYGPVTGAVSAGGAGVSTGTGVVGGVTDAASDTFGGIAALVKEPLAIIHYLTTPDAWWRILKVGGGIALIIGGALLLARHPVEKAGKVAGEAGAAAALL